MEQEKKNWHDKNYKKLLLIPLGILLFSIVFMAVFYSQNGDFIYRDVSLTGGTTATIYDQIDVTDLKQSVSGDLEDLKTRKIYDLVTNEYSALTIETKSDTEVTKSVLEDYVGYELTQENSSFQYTGAALSESFFQQLLLAVLYAFLFMGVVVFFIFGQGKRIKALLAGLALLSPLLFFGLKVISIQWAFAIVIASLIISLFIYVKKNIPSFAVIISAVLDIFMTLVLVNVLGIETSTAGIVAFLMLIGYSVDTDIMLTNRVLKRHEGTVNDRMGRAFKTGLTMTLTSLIAMSIALIIVEPFSVTLTQIFTIIVIGLSFDILNTWITNASILKWYIREKTSLK